MNFREAKIDDLSFIVEVYNDSIPGRLATADIHPVSIEEKTTWFESHKGNRPVFIIEKDNQSVGWLSFGDFYGRTAYAGTAEISIYIHPDKQRKGAGKAALEFAIQIAPSLGIEQLLGFVFAHNVPSLTLFKNAGFKTWGHLPEVAKMDGKKYSLEILGKKI